VTFACSSYRKRRRLSTEIIRAGQRLGKARERVARGGDKARHAAIEHSGKPVLVCAESNKHGAMVVNASLRHVAAKDVPKPILIHASDMRVRRLIFEFDAVGLGASHDAFLLRDRQSFPLSNLVLPLLK
jgi:hypothetical protein